MRKNVQPEFTDEQLQRLDNLQNAAYEFLKVLCETDDIPWDVGVLFSMIYDNSLIVEQRLHRNVRIPTRVTMKDGKTFLFEYSDETPENIHEALMVENGDAYFTNKDTVLKTVQ